MARQERLLEELPVKYGFDSSDLSPGCIRLGRTKDGTIYLYYMGGEYHNRIALSPESAETLWEQLDELLLMNSAEKMRPEGSS